ncbi:hypothetical protein STEG23_021665 [Scotinomys teguina]
MLVTLCFTHSDQTYQVKEEEEEGLFVRMIDSGRCAVYFLSSGSCAMDFLSSGRWAVDFLSSGRCAAVDFLSSGRCAAVDFLSSGHCAVDFLSSGRCAAVDFLSSGRCAAVDFLSSGRCAAVDFLSSGRCAAVDFLSSAHGDGQMVWFGFKRNKESESGLLQLSRSYQDPEPITFTGIPGYLNTFLFSTPIAPSQPAYHRLWCEEASATNAAPTVNANELPNDFSTIMYTSDCLQAKDNSTTAVAG